MSLNNTVSKNAANNSSEMTGYIVSSCLNLGMKFPTNKEEEIFLHHVRTLVERIEKNDPLGLTEYDKTQIDEEAWKKARKVAGDFEKKFGYEISELEQFLLGTYFQLYR